MKKLIILLAVAVLVTSFAFAQDDGLGGSSAESNAGRTNTGRTNSIESNSGTSIERFNAEINLGFPIHWTNGQHDNALITTVGDEKTEDKTVTATTSIGVGITFNFTNKIGLIVEGDFFYGAELTGISNPTSDYISLAGGNIFLGPLFYLFNNNVFRIPLAVGLHYYGFSDSLWMPGLEEGAWVTREDHQFGAGVSLGFQFHFESGIYLFSRTSVTLDFLRWHSMSGYYVKAGETDLAQHRDEHGSIGTEIKEENIFSWNVKPSIGIGIRF